MNLSPEAYPTIDLAARKVMDELRCIAAYHQRVTKAEVRVRVDFLADLAALLDAAIQKESA